MKTIDLKPVGEAAKIICKGLAYGLVLSALCGTKVTVTRKYVSNSTTETGYYDAVESIMQSSMWDSAKQEAIEMLKKDGDNDYYKAVISIANSSMWANQKLETIEILSKK